MTVSTAFGPAVSAVDVEQAALDTLKTWMKTYLCWVDAKRGRPQGTLPPVKSWTTANEFVKWPEDQLPAVILVSPGTVDVSRDGPGLLTVTWEINVGLVCAANTREASNALVKDYAMAACQALLNNGGLGGLASGLWLVGEGYDDVPQNYLRSGAVAQVDFHVIVDAARSTYGGPDVPGCDQPDLGLVQEVDIDALASRVDSGQDPDLMHLVERTAP